MKSKVMDRPLFKGKKGMSMEEAQDVGIMDGFLSSVMGGDLDERPEPEDDDEYDTRKASDRSPDSPEILMNNLRGDMRSVDARVDELADMVGMRAARETPPEVLALLQPVLAGQGAPAALPPGGIGALMPAAPAPAMPGAAPAPDMGAPMPMPPEAAGGIAALGAPPTAPGPAPQGFAHGGYVQHFQQGSDEEGVTPANQSSYVAYPPEMVQKAREYLMNTTASAPLPVPDLSTGTAKRAKAYQDILGSTGDLTKAQMLFDVAGGFLNVAAGTDAEGRPLRGGPSAAMRLAAGLKNVPGLIGARAGEQAKSDRAIKASALEATEKEIQNVREYNAKVIESNRKRFETILKGSGMSSLFGKGDWEWNVVNQPGLLANWAAGKTSTEQDNLIDSAITSLRAPKTETRTDPVSKQPYTVTVPGVVPKFVEDAESARARMTGQKPPARAAATSGAPVIGAPATGAPAPGPAAGEPAKAGAKTVQTPNFYDPEAPTLFNLSGKGTGVVAVFKSAVEKLPFINQFVSGSEQLYATDFLTKSVDTIGKAIRINPRFAEGERKEIERKLDIEPQILDNQQAYITRLMSLQDLMTSIRRGEYKKAYQSPQLKPEDIGAAREKIQDIDEIMKMIGLPPELTSKSQWENAPSGAVFVVKQTGEIMIK